MVWCPVACIVGRLGVAETTNAGQCGAALHVRWRSCHVRWRSLAPSPIDAKWRLVV